MANCNKTVGIKNILVKMTNCDTGEVIPQISHQLATEELPTWKVCTWKNDPLPGGFVRRVASQAGLEIKLIRDDRIPLAYYQGCATWDIQVEYVSGLVYTGTSGGVTGDTKSDSHQVDLNIVFDSIAEQLPGSALAA